jgi:hypothetical protein
MASLCAAVMYSCEVQMPPVPLPSGGVRGAGWASSGRAPQRSQAMAVASPSPAGAIHCAFLSCWSCLSSRLATSLRWAAARAAGAIRPIRQTWHLNFRIKILWKCFGTIYLGSPVFLHLFHKFDLVDWLILSGLD